MSTAPNTEKPQTPDGKGDGQPTAELDEQEVLRLRAKERDQERRYAHQSFAAGLLPVIDNLERATAAAQQAGETGPLVQGVGMVHAQLLELLKKNGISPIEAQGKPFDPNEHEAVMRKPTDEAPANTVVQVLEQGFTIHDRVLRPARVVVSVPKEDNK